jgi:threonine dehydratase
MIQPVYTRRCSHKERVILDQVGIFADGTAVKQVGVLPFEIAQHYVDDVITVTTDEICAAIKDTFDATRSIAEPSGALALAGLKRYMCSRLAVRTVTSSRSTVVPI